MSADKDLKLLAEFLEQSYVLPYTHDELLDILSRIRDGYLLEKSEYETLKDIIVGAGGEDGEPLFSGDYSDLANKPQIPNKLSDLNDYSAFMSIINNTWAELKAKDQEIEDKISDNARFVSALEVVLSQDVARLEKMIKACTLFEGDSLESVISNLRAELAWLDNVRNDLIDGKVLSEKDFLAEYEEILREVNQTAEGLAGYIKKVIAESIIEPGEPNGNGVYRLDSIGEALATKVDKVYGYGLSQHDFSNKYKEILDNVLAYVDNDLENGIDLSGTLQGYVINIVNRYKEEFYYMINDVADRIQEYTENEVQAIKKQIADKFVALDESIDTRIDYHIGDRLQNVENSVDKKLQEVELSIKNAATDVVFKEGDGPVGISVGGLSKGATLEGRTIREVLLEMLCPFMKPTGYATLILGSGDYLCKIGTIVEILGVGIDVIPGTLPVSKIVFKRRLTGYQYEVLGTYDASTSAMIFNEPFEITQSIDNKLFVVEITDTGGNTTVVNTESIEITYPLYYGTLPENSNPGLEDIGQLNEQLSRSGSDFSVKYTTNNDRMVFAVPQSYGTVKEIQDQNGYNITKSFKTNSIVLEFKVLEEVNGIVKENIYKQNYTIYYNSPTVISGFEITYKF